MLDYILCNYDILTIPRTRLQRHRRDQIKNQTVTRRTSALGIYQRVPNIRRFKVVL